MEIYMCLLLMLRLLPDRWAGPTLRPSDRRLPHTWNSRLVPGLLAQTPASPPTSHASLPHLDQTQEGPRDCLTCSLWDNICLQL